MEVRQGLGRTKYGPGVDIRLTGDEVAVAIDAYLVAHRCIVAGPRTITVNDELCEDGRIYVDPSGFVIHDGCKIEGGPEHVEFEMKQKFNKVKFSARVGDGWPVLRSVGSREETIARDDLEVGMIILVKHPSGPYVKAIVDKNTLLECSATVGDGKWIVLLRLSEDQDRWVSDTWCNLAGIAKLHFKE